MKHFVKYYRVFVLAVMGFSGACAMNPSGGPQVLYLLSPPNVKVSGDGSSLDKPLYIHHASASDLRAVESSWLYKRFGGTYEIMDQAWDARVTVRTEHTGKRIFDIATLALPDGSTRTAYFDVTNYR